MTTPGRWIEVDGEPVHLAPADAEPSPEAMTAIEAVVRAAQARLAEEPDPPPFTCPACDLKHHRVSAHGLLRPNAVQGRRALCGGCLEDAGIGA